MVWIEVHQTLPAHRKIKKLKRELKTKTPQAVGHMVMLWLWAVDNAPDGNLSDIDPNDLAEAAEWSKSGSEFVNALISAGFLDEGMQLHDWDQYVGRLIDKRETKRAKDRERQRRARDRNKQPVNTPGDPSCHAPVTRDNGVMSRTCHAPNSTVPNSTLDQDIELNGGIGISKDIKSAEPIFSDISDLVGTPPPPPPLTVPYTPPLEDQDAAAMFTAWDRASGRLSSPAVSDELRDLLAEYGLPTMLEAIRQCVQQDVVKLAYLKAVLRGGVHSRDKEKADADKEVAAWLAADKEDEEAKAEAANKAWEDRHT